MALRLYVDEHGTIGGINLYSRRGYDIEPHAPTWRRTKVRDIASLVVADAIATREQDGYASAVHPEPAQAPTE
jgi:hypothetical protein